MLVFSVLQVDQMFMFIRKFPHWLPVGSTVPCHGWNRAVGENRKQRQNINIRVRTPPWKESEGSFSREQLARR
jgi:hypothetical protein